MKHWYLLSLSLVLSGAGTVRATSDSCCGTPCPPGVTKQCVAKPDVKKTTKTVYSCRETDFCLKAPPRFTLFRWLHKDCAVDCCGCPDPNYNLPCENCGCVRSRNVLIKKERTCEEPTTKCEVEHVLCPTPCQSPCGTVILQGQPMIIQGQPAQRLEQAPMPSPKK